MTFAEAKLFLQTWYGAQTHDQVCERLQLDRRTLDNLAANMRRHGVPLCHLSRRMPGPKPKSQKLTRANYEELARLAASLQDERIGRRYRQAT